MKGEMLKTLVDLKETLDAAQEMHKIKEQGDLWDLGIGVIDWSERAICETMLNFTNVMNYFGKREEALIYAVQASLWALKCIEDLKQVLVFRSRGLRFNDEKKFFDYSQTYFDLVLLYGLTL